MAAPTKLGAYVGYSTIRMRTASKGVIAKHVKKVATAPESSTSGTRASMTASAPAQWKKRRWKNSYPG